MFEESLFKAFVEFNLEKARYLIATINSAGLHGYCPNDTEKRFIKLLNDKIHSVFIYSNYGPPKQ
jgi:hypothetical protein